MRRRDFIPLVGGAAALPLAHAQTPKNVQRLCFVTFDPGTLQSNRFDAFFQGLRNLGYVPCIGGRHGSRSRAEESP
jgi:putative ABC transport system substrate-binding protein